MSWAEWKIQQYYQGKKANWLEKHFIDHANPVHFVLHIVGAIPLIWGLWIHNWGLIILGFILHGIGHLYCSLIKNEVE